MKKLFVLLILASISFIGCQEEQGVLSPDINESGSKITADEVNWISLPKPEAMGVENVYTTSALIDGSKGGKLKISEKYHGGIHGKVEIKAELKFEKHSFVGTKLITMSINSDFGTATFSPHGVFDIPAEYELKLKGLDLSSVSPASVDFVYETPQGAFQSIVYDDLNIDLSACDLEVKKAKLPHFSRYGFVK